MAAKKRKVPKKKDAGTSRPKRPVSDDAEKRYRSLFEGVPIGLYRSTPSGQILDINPALVRLLGYPDRESLLAVSVSDLYKDPMDRKLWLALIEREGIVRNFEVQFRTYDGSIIWVRDTGESVRDESGRVVYYNGNIEDITERKLVEGQIRWLASFPEMNPNPVIEMDAQGTITFANAATLKTLRDLGLPENPALFVPENKEDILRLLRETGELQVNREIILNNEIFAEDITLNHELRVIRIYARNITDRKRAEVELVSAQQSLKEAHHLAHIGTWNWVMENDTVTWSEELYIIAGRDPSLPAPTYAEHPRVYTPASWDRLSSAVTRALTTGELYNLELELVRPDGSIRWVNAFGGVKRNDDGKVIGLHGTVQDITDRKRVEQALEKSVQLLKDTGEMAQVGGWELDLSTKEVSWTEEVGRIHGVGPGYKPKLEEALNFYAPESRPAVEAVVKKTAETGEPYDLESLFNPSGSKDQIWVRSLGRGVYSDGKIVKLIGTFQNIDKYKKAEEVLRETNEYLHKLIDFASAPIIVWDPAFRITRFNEAFEHLTGRTEQEGLGQKIDILFPEESREASLALIKKTLEGDRWESVKIPIFAADGTIHTVLWNSANILTEGAELVSTIAQGIDITKMERTEEALRESGKKYRAVVEDQTEFICRFTPDGMLTFVNDAYCRYFGLNRDECIGKEHTVLLPPDAASLMKKHIRSLTLENPVATIRHRIITPSGEVRWQRWSDRAIFDKNGHAVEYQSVGRDITDVIKAEDALRGSEERYHNIIEDQTEFICRFTPDGTHIFVNDAYCRYFDKKREEILGHHFKPVIHPEDREIVARYIASLTPRNPVMSIDQRIVMPDGSTRWQRWSDRAIFDRDGHVVEYQSVGRDITERKEAEEAIQHALAEKEILLREIHHRVKNNLAGIISLINLQIGSLTDPLLISQFNDLETRIRSMALVHESLSVTKDLARINVATYTENLTRHLFQIYGKATNIRCRIDMGDVMMPIETAIPCGLVMNEIVTNSLKYAFPPTSTCVEIRGEPCTITLTLHREGNNYRLMIADNGIGMPEGIDITAARTLGLYLIRFIVNHQMRGSLEVSTAGGTAYMIRFPEQAVKERHADE